MDLPVSTLHSITVHPQTSAHSPILRMGTPTGPIGTIETDGVSLLRNGQRWAPTMGEFHYARYPEGEWWRELLKLKAGGIDVLATYVFWIHHEEIQGKWRWDGDRNLRAFIEICRDVDLPLVLRLGPWSHGEVRNGGFPDWIVETGNTRQDDPTYLGHVKRLYQELGYQAEGLLWKDGGPLIGVQVENEYGGPAEHLLTLKAIAIEAGFDVPLYTRTGWPSLSTVMPFGEILPLYGAYPEGFWDRSLESMPNGYWRGYTFNFELSHGEMGNERHENMVDEPIDPRYPFLTCEMGGGIQVSYHRRIKIDPEDIDSLALVKLGSGSNMLGYYMAHGGTNPDGELTTLQESQANGEWNDLPVKSYDFQTLLGEFGQVREQYHRLRAIHLFLRDWGAELAPLDSRFPITAPSTADDSALRWAVRTDGKRGFVFINNYQRGRSMPAKPDTALQIDLPKQSIKFPAITVPADSSFFLPFDFDLGGKTLLCATAQPICRVGQAFFFKRITGIPAIFGFIDGRTLEAREQVLRDGDTTFVVLTEEESQRIYKEEERVILFAGGVEFDGALRLSTSDRANPDLLTYPRPRSLTFDGQNIEPEQGNIFTRYVLPWPAKPDQAVHVEKLKSAGPAREIPIGSAGVAAAPSEEDFENAAVWRLRFSPEAGRILRIHYRGDVARLCEGDRLLCDNYYNGTPFEFGTWRAGGALLLKVLPLRRDAPIMLSERPPEDEVADLQGVEIVQERTLIVTIE